MAGKASLTPQDWDLLLQGPMMAGMAVSAAEPSGLFGMLQESFATGKLLVQATSDTTANELVRAVAADYGTAEGRKAASEGLKAKLGLSDMFFLAPRVEYLKSKGLYGAYTGALYEGTLTAGIPIMIIPAVTSIPMLPRMVDAFAIMSLAVSSASPECSRSSTRSSA